MDSTPEPEIKRDIQEIEFDKIWHCIGSNKDKPWIIKALDRGTGRPIAWVTGHRDAAPFPRLYDKVKHLKDCPFYTDDREAFAKVLTKKRPIIGKSGTVSIERDNSNTRHHLGPMTRRTQILSKKQSMVYSSIKLWSALTNPDTFLFYQKLSLSIFI